MHYTESILNPLDLSHCLMHDLWIDNHLALPPIEDLEKSYTNADLEIVIIELH